MPRCWPAGTLVAYALAGSAVVFLVLWALLAWLPSGGFLAAARIRHENNNAV